MSTQRGGEITVTLVQIIDPAKGSNSFLVPDAGKRFIAAKFTIVNTGTQSETGDANNNATVIGSDNQSYTADSSDVVGCTNFAYGQYTLAPSDSATGCVVYQLPTAVQPSKVQFNAASGFGDQTGEWLAP